MKHSEKMPAKTNAELVKIAESYHLDLVVLYGSRARGSATDESDTDIAVRADRPLLPDEKLELSRQFDALFSNSEVCDLKTAPPLLLAAVSQDGKAIYQKSPSLFAEFKLYAMKEYIEFKPMLEKLRQKNAKRIAELES